MFKAAGPLSNGQHVLKTDSPLETVGYVVPGDGKEYGIYSACWGEKPWMPLSGKVTAGEQEIGWLLHNAGVPDDVQREWGVRTRDVLARPDYEAAFATLLLEAKTVARDQVFLRLGLVE